MDLALDRDLTADQAAAQLRQQGFSILRSTALTALASTTAADLAALTPAWDDLPPDRYLRDGGRYRRRRHGSVVIDDAGGEGVVRAVPHRAHWQSTTYNALHGGLERWFEPLAPALADSGALRAVIAGLGRLFADVRNPDEGRWYVELHPFRIDTTDGVGRPTPEGAHRDGVDFVAVILIARHAVHGGETRVFDADGPLGVRFTLAQPWSALILDDTRVIHESTPLQPAGAGLGHRDTLVVTFRGGGFQDPP
jgi:hypothetical protein